MNNTQFLQGHAIPESTYPSHLQTTPSTQHPAFKTRRPKRTYLSIKDFGKTQHYTDRNPPWVKLHKALMQDPEFLMLSEIDQCRYMKLLLVASQCDNKILFDEGYLQKVLCVHGPIDLTPLIHSGLLLAWRKQKACSEAEAEAEAEKEKNIVGQKPDVQPSLYISPHWKEAEDLLDYLNTQTGKHFAARHTNKQPTHSLTAIQALLKKGYSPVQVRQVIANRWMKWGSDVKMQEYLRPITLFRPSNFDNYVGELNKGAGPSHVHL